MLAYLSAIWRCRYFWLNLVRIDLRARYRRSILGLGWSLMQPLTMTVIFCLIVRPLLMPHKSLGECILFFLTGLACWHFMVNVTVQGCLSLIRGEAYIRQYPAPLAIYPLRTTLVYSVHLLIVLGLIVLVSCISHRAIPLAALLSLLPGVLMLLLLGWSLAVLAGFANVYFQDVQHLCEVGFQILFYGTPILYSPEVLRGKSLEWVLYLNPLTPFIQLIREPLLNAQPPAAGAYVWAACVMTAFVAAACTMLATQQRRIIFYM